MGIQSHKVVFQLNTFKRDYRRLIRKNCEAPHAKLQKLFQKGESILQQLGFKCKEGFWSCSRIELSRKSHNHVRAIEEEKNPDISNRSLKNALLDRNIFGSQKLPLFVAQQEEENGYKLVDLALIEIRKFVLQEKGGNAALAVGKVVHWLRVPRLLHDRNIAHHARVQLITILKRIPAKNPHYDHGIKNILWALRANYSSRPAPKPSRVASPVVASPPVPVVIIPQRTPLPTEYVFNFAPNTYKTKREDTVGSFQKGYQKLIAQSLKTAFPIRLLRGKVTISNKFRNGNIEQVAFTHVQVRGDVRKSEIRRVLRGVAENLRRGYKFVKGVPETFEESFVYIRVRGEE
jgi:hypothetical protein